MNLQHAKNNPGKFHKVRATATKFDVKQGDYGEYALGILRDEMGNEEKVLFAVKEGNILPNISSAQQLGIWGIRYDANTDNFKAYYNGAVTKQPQGQQASQTASESTKPPRTQSNAPAWQALDRELVQKDVICALLASRKRPEPNEVKIWVDYIMDGVHPDSKPQSQANPNYVGDDPPQTDEDGIPF